MWTGLLIFLVLSDSATHPLVTIQISEPMDLTHIQNTTAIISSGEELPDGKGELKNINGRIRPGGIGLHYLLTLETEAGSTQLPGSRPAWTTE